MNEVSHRRFAFGTASIGIGVTPKTLRNWLDREQVILETERTEGGHYRFSWSDILVLSVVAELVRCGVNVKEAYHMTDGVRMHTMMLNRYRNAPLAALEAAISYMALYAQPPRMGESRWYYGWHQTGIRSDDFERTQPLFIRLNAAAVFAAARARIEEWEEGLDDNEIGPDGQFHGAVMDGAPLPVPGDKPTE